MKVKAIVFLVMLSFTAFTVKAQIVSQDALKVQQIDSLEGWKRGGVTSLNLAQTSLTNWAAGGQNSFSVNSLISLFSNYRVAETAWDNTLDIGYGLLRQGAGADFIKTDDRFDFMSKYGRKAFDDFFYAAMVNFRTQMTEGLDYANDTTRISDLLAPAYLLGALGLDYKPNNYFSAFIAPVTAKLTIVNDQALANAGAFGVTPAVYDAAGNVITPGEKLKSEFGGYLRLVFTKNDFTQELLRNVYFTTKADFFSNYVDNPQNIDINWETTIALKVNRFLSVNISTHLIYDDDINIVVDGVAAPRVQFKEILGVGFSYTF
jgi:hypothetical protein